MDKERRLTTIKNVCNFIKKFQDDFKVTKISDTIRQYTKRELEFYQQLEG